MIYVEPETTIMENPLSCAHSMVRLVCNESALLSN